MISCSPKFDSLHQRQDPDDRIPNFCYIQVTVFDLSYLRVAAVGTQQVRYHEKIVQNIKDIKVQPIVQALYFIGPWELFLYFSHFFMVAYLLSPNRCNWQIAQVKNCNLNVTEIRDSDLKKFSGNFQFHRRDPIPRTFWKIMIGLL